MKLYYLYMKHWFKNMLYNRPLGVFSAQCAETIIFYVLFLFKRKFIFVFGHIYFYILTSTIWKKIITVFCTLISFDLV